MPDQTEADLRAVAEAATPSRYASLAMRWRFQETFTADRVLALLDTITDLRAERDAAMDEVMGHQVGDGYQKGYEHGQALAAQYHARAEAAEATVTALRAKVEATEAKSDSRADRITRALGAEITRARAMRDKARADATALRDRVTALTEQWEREWSEWGGDTLNTGQAARKGAAVSLRAALAPAPLAETHGNYYSGPDHDGPRAACKICPPAPLDAREGEEAHGEVWVDRQGDTWALGDDGLMHSPETAPFSREHVEKKWGPLRLAPYDATGRDLPATPADQDER